MDYTKLIDKKRELDRYRPLPTVLVKNLEDWFRIELTYTSNAIEGNTLTRAETALVVEKGLTIGGKSLVEHLEASNHAYALEWISKIVSKTIQDLDEKTLLGIHRCILKSIDEDNAGFYRTIPVRISGSTVVLPNPRKVPDLMRAFMVWLKKTDADPVDVAALAHYKLVTIHPFVDGNGRTARLLMNMILMMQGYPPAIIRPEDRLAYIKSLETAQLGGSLEPYLSLIAHAVERSLDIYLKAIKGEDAEHFSPPVALIKIGYLARETGIPVSTLRFWVQQNLLTVSSTTDSGYWLFESAIIRKIERIQALQKERYTTKEIQQMLKDKEL